MRSLMLVMAGLALIAGVMVFASSQAADAEKAEADLFVGTYHKLERFETRTGQFSEVPQITITKEGDTYILSKPYHLWKFKVSGKGEISDGKGGIGTIYHGEVRFADGHKVRVLPHEFCYEQFILYDMEANLGAPGQKRK